MKFQEILDGKWDNLIVLDACRYDIFNLIYREYLNGKLDIRLSRGSSTCEWLYKTFTEKMDDVTYISANPYINSKGLPLNKTTLQCKVNWNPKEYFRKIVDVWDFGWDEKLGTVIPEKVNEFLLLQLNENRKIIHYMQPHVPYIGLRMGSWEKARALAKGIKTKQTVKLIRAKIIKNLFKYVFPKEVFWRYKKLLKLPISNPNEIGYRFYGDKFYFYKDNLRRVLISVSDIINILEGEIIITADHGEAFGEQGDFGHPTYSDNPVLRCVPWLKIIK